LKPFPPVRGTTKEGRGEIPFNVGREYANSVERNRRHGVASGRRGGKENLETPARPQREGWQFFAGETARVLGGLREIKGRRDMGTSLRGPEIDPTRNFSPRRKQGGGI